jgi:tetratricopeptide (TPR) repeat protein
LILFGLVRAYKHLQTRAQKQQKQLSTIVREFLQQQRFWSLLIGITVAIIISISATYGKNHMLRMVDTIVHLKAALTVSRFHIWGPAMGMIKDHPLLGTGLDTFKTVFPRYATPDFAVIDGANVSSRTAHNEILQVLSTQGIIGLIIVTWLTIMILINWWKAYGRSKDNWQDRLVLVGLLASWSAYSVQNLFSFGVVALDSFYWLIVVFVVLFLDSPETQSQRAPQQEPASKPNLFFSKLAQFRLPVIGAILAFSVFMSVLVLRSTLADYAYNLGTIYRLRNMWDHCIGAFSKAAQFTPTEVKYTVYRGLAFEEKAKQAPEPQRMGYVQSALKSYARGVEMNPTNAYYLGNLGRAYALAAAVEPNNPEHLKNAVLYYKKAVHYAPVTVLFYQNLAMTFHAHDKEKEFVEVMDQLATFHPTEAARLSFLAANNHYNLNQLDKSVKYYEKAVAYKPDYAEAYFNMGVTCARMSKVDLAITHWQKVLEINPTFGPAKQMLERYLADPTAISGNVIMNPSAPR